VTDGTDVNVRFRTVKFFFCHSNSLIFINVNKQKLFNFQFFNYQFSI